MRQMEIESNERKYRLLAEAIPQIVFTFSPGAGLTYTNGKWSSYSGKSFDQTMGLGFMSCVHPEDRAKLQLPDLPTLQQSKAGIMWQTEIRLLSYKEEYRWFLVKCVSVDELDTGDVRWFGTW
jgi:PAS domain-containing protein